MSAEAPQEEKRPSKRQKVCNESSSSIVNSANATNGFNAASEVNNQSDLNLPSPKSIPLLPRDVKVLLLDIEGCTTSISFVHDILFPFALSNLSNYLDNEVKSDDNNDELNAILINLKDDVKKLDDDHPSKKEVEKKNNDNDSNAVLDAVAIKKDIQTYVQALMNHDVKATGLKSLQGKIWKAGYASGQIKGHIYQDFEPTLKWCKNQNISVNIYSSGSIGAQKLLFGNSASGDLCPYFNSHFDTTSGGKKEAESYKRIAKSLGIDVKDMCFVSDAVAELVAARDAGVGFVVMSVRPGNVPLADVGKNEFPIIHSLLQLCGSGH